MNAKKTLAPSGKDALSKAAAKAGLSQGEFEAVRDWLAEQLKANAYAKLGQGGHTNHEIDLQQVFVDLPVEDDPNSGAHSSKSRARFLQQFQAADALQLSRKNDNGQFSIHCEEVRGADKELIEILQDAPSRDNTHFNATVLIGGPGQGKSTLGQIACQLNRAALLKPLREQLANPALDNFLTCFSAASNDADDRGLSLPSQPFLPLQIALPDFTSWLAQPNRLAGDDNPVLLQFLAQLPSAIGCNLQALTLLNLMAHLPVLLVLDGFDEVGASDDRASVVAAAKELLHALAERNARVKILATTRPQGYAGELAHIGVAVMERVLVPLEPKEAMAYANKLITAKIPGHDEREKVFSRLQEAAQDASASRLLTTPLQVTILAALVQQLGRAPRERWTLFLRYFSYTYEREIERNTYASALLAEQRGRIEKIHRQVALLLQLEAEGAGGAAARMSRTQLEEVIRAVLAEEEVGAAESQQLVQEISKAVEQRLVFLVDQEDGKIGFDIRSLQEFMAAWALSSGREADVMERVRQIASAPMFRNVLLFIASRWFSEDSPLRDFLLKQICDELDTSDAAGRQSLAGALLALEIMEEGAALSQPRYAKLLMARAGMLLQLPPNTEHVRLTAILTSENAMVLQDAITSAIASGVNERQFHPQTAWICLFGLINKEVHWAQELAELYWSQLPEPNAMLGHCLRLSIAIGEWLSMKMEQSAELFYPEIFIRFASQGNRKPSTVFWLQERYVSAAIRGGRRLHLRFRFCARVSRLRAPVAATEVRAWRAWIAAAEFDNQPSAAKLADALQAIAESLPQFRWPALQDKFSWPLAVCLSAANSAADLFGYAKLVRAGTLGDIADWRQAESKWRERIDVHSALQHHSALWTVESIQITPPLLAIDMESFDFQTNKAELFQEADQRFDCAVSIMEQQRLAEICILLCYLVEHPLPLHDVQPLKWLRNFSSRATALVPKPAWLATSEWLALLEQTAPPERIVEPLSASFVLAGIQDAPAHPVVLRMAVLALRRGFDFVDNTSARIEMVQAKFANFVPQNRAQQADLATIQILTSSLPEGDEATALSDIVFSVKKTPVLLRSLIAAFERGAMSFDRASTMLAQLYAMLGVGHPLARTLIDLMRAKQQSRKSKLDYIETWDDLALPQPYPRNAVSQPKISEIPESPIRIASLELHNIRGIHQLALDFYQPPANEGQWVVILGPNGSGKTTILRSLALALRNVKDPALWPENAFTRWQRLGDDVDTSFIRVDLGEGDHPRTTINDAASPSCTQKPEQDKPRKFPIFAYGCRRGSALGGRAREADAKDGGGREIATLFDEGADLIHAETWLVKLEGDTTRNAQSRHIFDAVVVALKKLLSVDDITVQDQQVWVTLANRPALPLGSLSDGYLTSAGWFLDLVARWLELAKQSNEEIGADFLEKMRGLVLIDEIDLHLHPQWQVNIIRRTRGLLKQMSFIVTTHNPVTLVGVEPQEIWRLSTENGRVQAEKGSERPMLLSAGEIYASYFDIEDIYPNGLGRKLQRFNFLSSYTLRNDAEEAEVQALLQELEKEGIAPSWGITPRQVPEKSPKKTRAKKVTEAQ